MPRRYGRNHAVYRRFLPGLRLIRLHFSGGPPILFYSVQVELSSWPRAPIGRVFCGYHW
jgi:hypothetical protein